MSAAAAPPGRLEKFPLLARLAMHRRLRLLFEPREGRAGFLLLVFSKDRALQVDALLRSLSERTTGVPRVALLWRASHERHAAAYRQVIERARERGLSLEAVEERSFRADLLRVLAARGEGRVVFLVDDLLFRRRVHWAELAEVDPLKSVFSLRLGRGVTYCQPQQREQRTPPWLPPPRAGWLRWRWEDGELDWRFATALDGTVFDRREVLQVLERIPFKAPNSLEWALGQYARHFRRDGLCYELPRLVNLPLNGVQAEGFSFPHGGGDPEELLRAWEKRLELDLTVADSFPDDRTHAVLPVTLRRRS